MTINPIALARGLAAAAVVCVALPGPAQASLFSDDEARKAILELRQRVDANRNAASTALEAAQQQQAEQLKRALAAEEEANAQLRRSMLELSNQIELLRAELARMRGASEQLARDVADVQRQQRTAMQSVQTVEERLRKFEPMKVALDGREFMAEPAEMRDYEAALAIFRKGDFAAAQTAFGDFTRRYPASGYTPSAMFWLGNAQYATKDYKDAVANFRQLVTSSPDHVRAPEAMLSIANSQIELKDTRTARKTLEDLIKAYPQSEAAGAARERMARLR